MDSVRTILLGAISGAVAAAVGVGIWIYVGENSVGTGQRSEPAVSVAPAAVIAVGENSGFRSPVVSPASKRLQIDPLATSESFLAEAERKSHEASTRLEAVWSADKANPMQTRRTEQALLAAMNSEGVLELPEQPSRVVAIGCRATMCRIESEFQTVNSGTEWATRVLMGAMGEFGTSTFVPLPSEAGGTRLVIYAFKPGKDPRR
jgi:hypothetical protein